MSDDKNYIIDPLTCICKLALLHFMPVKTKLAINQHTLHIHEYSCYQWIERIKNGDSRKDLSHLSASIFKATQWYIVKSKEYVELDDITRTSIRNISEFSVKGLQKLQKSTYHEDTPTVIILQYLINMLSDALKNEWDGTKYIESQINNEKTISEKIKSNFDSGVINSISKMLTDAENNSNNDDIVAIIECVHKILMNKDVIFNNMMKKINTTL